MINIQNQKPSRTCTKTYSTYTSFRPHLKDDFNQRCGYCDDPDTHYGHDIGYHIDHFKPKSKFPNLEIDYNNLVYSCPYCNNSKSDKWQEEGGFIDPCDNEYDNHLKRDKRGKIQYKTDRGEYIYKSLKLHLVRHELIWLIGILERQKKLMKKAIDSGSAPQSILSEFYKIQCEIDNYTQRITSG